MCGSAIEANRLPVYSKGASHSPAASPFNEELFMQFIVTQRRISPPSRIGTSATGIPNLVLD